ncbi:hypothetical protein [Bacillus wiedmannii]|uniref:hypothetical protein n=1 Tax=Bacillus wiedmannii TaxID=1890302 RepID=UPI0012447D2D|nr:hypothetical protein [Bacillus wiedmannii]
MSNGYDSKRRPEIGVKDMDKYENGGLEVEERLTNGYLMYVPYGIHCDIFEAMEASSRLMVRQIAEYQNLVDKMEGKESGQVLVKNFKQKIDELKKHMHVMDSISPIKHEI